MAVVIIPALGMVDTMADKELELKPKQEKFAQIYVETGNASEAYRKAYNSKAKPESVNVNASKLLADTKVSLRVRQLRDELDEIGLWKRLDSIKTLAEIASGKDPEGKTSDRVNAVKALNSMHGWDAPTKLEHSSPDGSMTPTFGAMYGKPQPEDA